MTPTRRAIVYDVTATAHAGRDSNRFLMPLELGSMSREALLALKSTVEAEMASIRLQLETASARYNNEGIPSDPEWFTKARFALRRKGNHAQQIQVAIAAAARAERAARTRPPSEEAAQQKAFLHAYMRAAKAILGDADHALCIAAAESAAFRALDAFRADATR